MGRAVDLTYKVFLQIEADIFLPLYSELPEFEAYFTYYSEKKESFLIGTLQPENYVLTVD